jgi:hypothetical protein
MDLTGQEAGKMLFGLAILALLVTTLVAFGAMFMLTFTGNLNSGSAPTTTTTLFTGVANTSYALNAPIISVSTFRKASSISTYTQYNDTKLVGANGAVHITLDANAAHGGNTWNNLTVDFTLQGANATNTVRWVTGTCNAANKTWTSSPQSYTDINSTCLVPGGVLTFNFVNATQAGVIANVTNVTITYNRYVTNSAYTKNDAAGTVRPTSSGYYQIAYTYGAGGIDYTGAKTALSSGVTTITGIPSWLAIVILVIVLLVIFGLLAAIAYVAHGMMGGGRQ